MKKKFLLIPLLAGVSVLYGQTRNVGIETEKPHESALLEVSNERYEYDKKKGVLFPRVKTTERDAIVNPAEGLTIFNSDTKRIEFFNGTKWISIITL